MNTIFLGMALSFGYGLLSSVLIYYMDGRSESQRFLIAYTISFKTLISFGLILGTALVVFRSQDVIPETIEKAFVTDDDKTLLHNENYILYKKRFADWRRSMTFAAEFAVVGFAIFSYCQFPLYGLAEALMIIPACIQYALGVYVGRKLFYAGMMLHSLLGVEVSRNLFKRRELDDINTYVHIVSTLTIIFGYVHLVGYSRGPFLYPGPLGESIKILLMLPAFIATPVLLIFNFYPRAVLRKIYDQSIDIEVERVQKALQSEELSFFEKKSYLLEFDRMSREELRYSLQLTLSDLPIGITIFAMLLQSLLGQIGTK